MIGSDIGVRSDTRLGLIAQRIPTSVQADCTWRKTARRFKQLMKQDTSTLRQDSKQLLPLTTSVGYATLTEPEGSSHN